MLQQEGLGQLEAAPLGDERDHVLLDSVAEALVLKGEEIRAPVRAERADRARRYPWEHRAPARPALHRPNVARRRRGRSAIGARLTDTLPTLQARQGPVSQRTAAAF